MSKAISPDQARTLIASFAVDTPWESIQVDIQPFIELTPAERGKLFAATVKNGFQPVVTRKHLIDCDADPFIPEKWNVAEHQRSGNLKWNPATIALYLSKEQESVKTIKGAALRKELKGKSVLNACVLDYLLAHPQLIPEKEWKGMAIFFWGTIYHLLDGDLYVRYLYWLDGKWYWDRRWLGRDWGALHPAVLLAIS